MMLLIFQFLKLFFSSTMYHIKQNSSAFFIYIYISEKLFSIFFTISFGIIYMINYENQYCIYVITHKVLVISKCISICSTHICFYAYINFFIILHNRVRSIDKYAKEVLITCINIYLILHNITSVKKIVS